MPAATGGVTSIKGDKAATYPRYLRNPSPAYPKSELRRRREGLVILRVEVGTDGHPNAVSIEKSSGIKAFDRIARQTVRHWRFIPATRNGMPVNDTVQVPIHFQLTN
jgi:protein TonB